jgi:hypothetical protein
MTYEDVTPNSEEVPELSRTGGCGLTMQKSWIPYFIFIGLVVIIDIAGGLWGNAVSRNLAI